jgi:hypothetical protein
LAYAIQEAQSSDCLPACGDEQINTARGCTNDGWRARIELPQ